jgi:aminoglycoside phosphotransferase (APT) family kinase protein
VARRWIVDASNVFGARPDGWWRDRPRALSRLFDEIVRWRAETGDGVTVVADGHPSALMPEGTLYGVEVRYAHSSARDAADDEIVRIVGTGGTTAEHLTVVTSDRGLADRVRPHGVAVEGAGRFLARLADIEPRRIDRAVLAHFGIDEGALLGRGGEARVFAIDDERVLRLPHPGYPTELLEQRRALLAAIAGPGASVPTPQVLEQREVEGRVVVVERRLPGRNAMDVLAERRTDRAALIRDHLDLALRIADLPCRAEAFGELGGEHAITAPTFGAWACARLTASLGAGGPAFARLDPERLAADLVAALPEPEPPRPLLVHLDAFLGNMLAAGRRITALLDFGPMTIGGPRDLDALVAIAYLAPEITPTATDQDRSVAEAWAAEHGLGDAIAPVEQWIAAYWTGAPDDQRLRRWCERILL